MALSNPDYSELNHEEMANEIGLKAKHIPLLIASFLEESELILAKLQTAIESSDYEAIRGAAHPLKGSAGNLHFDELYEMSREMEFAGAERNSGFEYAQYLEAMSQAVATIKI